MDWKLEAAVRAGGTLAVRIPRVTLVTTSRELNYENNIIIKAEFEKKK